MVIRDNEYSNIFVLYFEVLLYPYRNLSIKAQPRSGIGAEVFIFFDVLNRRALQVSSSKFMILDWISKSHYIDPAGSCPVIFSIVAP